MDPDRLLAGGAGSGSTRCRTLDVVACERRIRLVSIALVMTAVAAAGCASSTPTVAGGPCVDGSGQYGSNWDVVVRVGEQSVDAAFGYASLSPCPGRPRHGEQLLDADGFYADLDSVIVNVEPERVITIVAPGYPDATVHAAWSGDSPTDSTDAEVTFVESGTWHVTAPVAPAVYRLDLRFEWFEGQAAWAALVATGAT